MVHSRPLILAVQNSLTETHGILHILKAILTTKEFKEAFAQILQWTGFFIFAPLIFVNLMYDRSGEKVLLRRRLALACLAIGVIAAIVINLLPNQALANVWFSSPNMYGGFLAVAVPLIFAKVLSHRNKIKAEWVWVSGLLGMMVLVALLYTMMDLWSVTALILGVVIAGFMYKARARTATIVILALIFVLALWPKQQVRNVYRFQTWQVPSDTQFVKKQYIEWYVAARRTIDPRMHAFATGIGAGNYQFSIGSYYARLPNEEKMPPGSNNLYLVLADDIGILGLASLLWMLGYFFKRAWEATRMNRNDWLGAGIIGLLVSFLFVNNFHALIVRGIGLILVFAFSLAIVAKMQAEAMLKESET
jgi:cell division protein FtsW (lipid II flippase)